MTDTVRSLPAWVTWQIRPFPDANLLLLHGREPVLIDSGFVGHAEETLAWSHAYAGQVALVVNTHWHSDHVGGNALLRAAGAGIAASALDADAVTRRDPGCCLAEYLDQPVSPYSIDQPLEDEQVLRLGEADWEVIRTPGHTPGHLALWQPEERLLIVGDHRTRLAAAPGRPTATRALDCTRTDARRRSHSARHRTTPIPTSRRRPNRRHLVRRPTDLRLCTHDPRRHPH